MDAKDGAETPGTGLTDVVCLLHGLPKEQLLSLTYQLGETPEEDIVHALSLLFLHKETQGLDRLQALQDNSLANHLAEKWRTNGGKSGDFREQCGHLDNVAVLDGMLAQLARVFKVLSEKSLCSPRQRDLAYWRAVSACGEKTSSYEFHRLIDEAKGVCGPEFAEKMHSQPRSEGETEKESTALSLSQGQSPEGNHSMPSSLQTSSLASYPSHLEISLPSTGPFGENGTAVKSQHSHPSTTPPSVHSSDSSEASSTLTPCSDATTHVNSPEEDDEEEKQSTATPSVRSKLPPSTPDGYTPKIPIQILTDTGKEVQGKEEEEEEEEEEGEEEEMFYAFVILHAAEDVDMAEAMKEKLESICGSHLVGATFSDDFALPGKSSLRCIDDAIDNTAYTILLLTNHFPDARRFQMETESALINSIEKRHKSNTVIPLLPRENSITKDSLPKVWQTLVFLKENSCFERNVKKLLTVQKVEKQRRIWLGEQKLKKERRLEKMKVANEQRKKTAMLEHERLRLYMEQTLEMQNMLQGLTTIPCACAAPFPGWPLQQQQQPQISINNAKYIMIGNDSRMNVDFGGSNTACAGEEEDDD